MYFPEWFYEDLYNHVNDGIFTSKNEGLGILWWEIVSSSVHLICVYGSAKRSFSDESKVLAITLDDKVSVAGIEQLASDLLPSRQFGHIVLHLGAHENDRDVGRAQCIPKFHVYIYIYILRTYQYQYGYYESQPVG